MTPSQKIVPLFILANEQVMEQAMKSNNTLGINLFKKLIRKTPSEEVLVSPYSAIITLAMARESLGG